MYSVDARDTSIRTIIQQSAHRVIRGGLLVQRRLVLPVGVPLLGLALVPERQPGLPNTHKCMKHVAKGFSAKCAAKYKSAAVRQPRLSSTKKISTGWISHNNTASRR